MCVLTLILENSFETKNVFQEKCEHGEMWENNFQRQFNSPRKGVTSKSEQKEKNARCIILFQGFPESNSVYIKVNRFFYKRKFKIDIKFICE